MGRQIKKRSRSFSLDEDEFRAVMERVAHHKFKDRNQYLMALIECDEAYKLRPAIHEITQQKVLRLPNKMIGFEPLGEAYEQLIANDLAVAEEDNTADDNDDTTGTGDSLAQNLKSSPSATPSPPHSPGTPLTKRKRRRKPRRA